MDELPSDINKIIYAFGHAHDSSDWVELLILLAKTFWKVMSHVDWYVICLAFIFSIVGGTLNNKYGYGRYELHKISAMKLWVQKIIIYPINFFGFIFTWYFIGFVLDQIQGH